jgi:tRNA threonylcarbamoyladenosine biosynthesis protein TsaB
MNVLAIDTCLGALSVAVGRAYDGRYCVIEAYEERSSGHAERLAPLIEAQMARAGLAFRDLARVAITLGPGSFTGVRTGVAAARGLRLAAGVEVVGLSSLAVMAHRVFEVAEPKLAPRPLLVAIDARRGRLYGQLFASCALSPISEPEEMTAAAGAALALAHGARVAGSGASAVLEADPTIEVACTELEPHAGDLAWLASSLTPLDSVDPIYIRPPDAKPQVDKRLARTP